MRIAVVSDIHGNWTALEAVLNQIKRESVDRIICLGDFIDPMPSSRRVFEFLKAEKILCLKGNHEDYVISAFEDPQSKMNLDVAFRPVKLTATLFDAASIQDLKNLPFTYTVESERAGDLFLCHASPLSNLSGWRYEMPQTIQDQILERPESTLICGHWHDTETREWNSKQLVTVGSVGVPLSGTLAPEYLIVEESGSGWAVEHKTVAYDPEPTLQEYKQMGWLKRGGPVGWILFFEIVSATRTLKPFFNWLKANDESPQDEEEWSRCATQFLEELGAWTTIQRYF